MQLRLLNFRLCIGCFLLGVILIQAPHFISYAQSSLKRALPQLSAQELSAKELCNRAKLFTVKVVQGDSWGSGILVQKQGTQYTLVTNGHVLRPEKEKYSVETNDGKKYEAFVLVRFDHGKLTGEDLAILQFNSPINYQVATLAKWVQREKVMASGFPFDAARSLPQGFMCTQIGQVSRRLDQSMQQGYQLGYFLDIRNGMSGGPLLNTQGKVVGINGMAQPAIFTNPDIYLYRNGLRVSESLGLPTDKALDLLSSSSWAIPSEELVYLSPSALNLTISSSNLSNISRPVAAANTPIASSELEKMAQKITVLIARTSTLNLPIRNNLFASSGVIIAREGKTYYILTSESGVRTPGKYEITTSNIRKYPISIVKKYPDLDLAILKFISDEDYSVAKLGNATTLAPGNLVSVAGWFGVEKVPNFAFVDGEFVDSKALNLGANLLYTNRTTHGMIGGAVFDQKGYLIGIHKGLRKEGGIREGVPINTFLQIAPPEVKRLLANPTFINSS